MLDEAQIAGERITRELVQHALVTQAAMSAIPNMAVTGSSTKKSQKSWSDLVEKIMGE